MKILNQINDLTDDLSDEELVRDAMLKGCKKIIILTQELKEAKSYKADAERYRLLAKLVDIGDWSCSYSVIRDSYGRIDEFYMSDKNHMDKTIDQAMKESKK